MADGVRERAKKRAEARAKRRSLVAEPFEALDASAGEQDRGDAPAQPRGGQSSGGSSFAEAARRAAISAVVAAVAGGLAGAARAVLAKRAGTDADAESGGEEASSQATRGGEGDSPSSEQETDGGDREGLADKTGSTASEEADTPQEPSGQSQDDEDEDESPSIDMSGRLATEEDAQDDERTAQDEDDEPTAHDEDDEPTAQEDEDEPTAQEDDNEPTAEEEQDEPEASQDGEAPEATADSEQEPEAREDEQPSQREQFGDSDESESDGQRPVENPGELVRQARQQLEQLTGNETESVTGVRKEDDGWAVTVEVVEVRRVPDSTDVLSSYEVVLDDDGSLVSFERTRRYRRSQVDEGG